MVWEWQVWRCFDNIRETFEEKGWEHGFAGRCDNEAVPLLATSGDHRISFFKRDPGTGECWFELYEGKRDRRIFLRGVENIPTPEQAAKLLVEYSARSSEEVTDPHEHPVYSLPVAPLVPMAQAG